MTDFVAAGVSRAIPETLNARGGLRGDAPHPRTAGVPFNWAPDYDRAGSQTEFVARLAYIEKSLTGRTLRSVRMGLDRAWSRLLALNVQDAFERVCAIEPSLSDLGSDDLARLRCEIELLRAVGFAMRDDCVAALPIALPGIDAFPCAFMSFVATTLCRLAYWKLGDLQRFHSLRHEPSPPLEKRYVRLLAFDRGVEAAIELQQLRFSLAERLARDALALCLPCGGRVCATGYLPIAILAQVLYERGEVPEAEALVRNHLPLIAARGSPEATLRVYPLLARAAVRRAQGDLALLVLSEGEALGERRGWPRLTAACLQLRVELLVLAGRLDNAHAALERMQPLLTAANRSHYADATVRRCFALSNSGIALSRQPSVQVVATLRHLQHEAALCGDLYLSVQLAIRVAQAQAAIGEEFAATQTLARSLELGATVGLRQSFIDGGPVIGQLLVAIATQIACGRCPPGTRDRRFLQPYVASLIHGCRSAEAVADAPKTRRSTGPLSSRECGILELIRGGYSNKRIATALGIAPETVKSHAKHIFAKLGARNRVEAVSLAVSLGLI